MTLTQKLSPTSNAQDWDSDPFDAIKADTGAAVTLTGLTLTLELRAANREAVITGSTTTGEVVIADNEFRWLIPAVRMRELRPGTYIARVRSTDPATGSVDLLLNAPIEITDGGFQ